MFRLWKISISMLIVLLAVVSCRTFSSILHDGEVVAKVGRHRLYRSDLDKLLPVISSSEDSMALASQYIKTWAVDIVFLDVAESYLSKSDKDVTEELEDYRRSLLKYRYEQKYVNERLDTAVSENELQAYYESHKDHFVLDVPIAKVRYMRISADSPNLNLIKKKMSSEDVNELVEADSLAYFSADIYTDYGGRWIDMVTLARKFGTDYGSLLAKAVNSGIEMEGEEGKVNFAYIADFISAGNVSPLEFCRGQIRDIIISTRKQNLIVALERDLLDDALAKGKFEIF